MTTIKQWWRPKEKLVNYPGLEKSHDVPSGYVIVDRAEWENAKKKFNLNPASVIKRMILGATIGFVAISFFVLTVNEPDPAWGKYWMIRPLIITPLASAFGILSFYIRDFLHPKNGLLTFLIFLTSFIAFVIALWLGIVLGLDGTLWN